MDVILECDAGAALAAIRGRATSADLQVASDEFWAAGPSDNLWSEHVRGLGCLSDLGSRKRMEELYALAAAFGIKLRRLALPARVADVIRRIEVRTAAVGTESLPSRVSDTRRELSLIHI